MSNVYQIRAATAADATEIAKVQVATWQTTYGGILPEALIERVSVEDRAKGWQAIFAGFAETGQGGALVVEQDSRVIGFASYGAQRDADLATHGYDAELTAVYLEAPYQRAGLGRALMAEIGQQIAQTDLGRPAVWVIVANSGACAFFDAIGGQVIASRSDPQGGDMDERAYGWDTLPPLR